jgi:hypothetical protein
LDLLHPTKAKTNPNIVTAEQNPDRHPTTTRTTMPRRPILSSLVLLQMLLTVHLMVVSLLLSGGRVVRAFSAPTTTTATAATTTAAWFPRTIQETIPYSERVKSLFLRHIVTETRDMGVEAQRLVLSAYTTSTTAATPTRPDEHGQKESDDNNDDYDPFGTIARLISACAFTRDEGGRIGWIDSSSSSSSHSSAGATTTGGGTMTTTSMSMILPPSLIEELYRRQPKAGDMELLYDDSSNRWHLIQVAEVWLQRPIFVTEQEDIAAATRVGSFAGVNLLAPHPRQLKGRGVRPTFTLVDLVTYDIQTAGCQMNVADSERGMYGLW